MSVRTFYTDLPAVASASPGFSFGRSGNVVAGTWLSNESVPSNKAGRWNYLKSAKVTRVYVANEIVDTYDLEVYYHDGNEAGLTSLGTVSIVAAKGGAFEVEWPIPQNKQIAVKLSTGSAKNLIVGVELRGIR